MGIGNQLKQVLDERNMNVNEFAKTLGVRAQRLYNIINRDTKKVQNELMQHIADALGVPIDYFYSSETLRDYINNNINNEGDSGVHTANADISNNHLNFNEASKRDLNCFKEEFFESVELKDEFSRLRDLRLLSYYYYLLNEAGQKELLKRLSEMIRIKEYRRKDDNQ